MGLVTRYSSGEVVVSSSSSSQKGKRRKNPWKWNTNVDMFGGENGIRTQRRTKIPGALWLSPYPFFLFFLSFFFWFRSNKKKNIQEEEEDKDGWDGRIRASYIPSTLFLSVEWMTDSAALIWKNGVKSKQKRNNSNYTPGRRRSQANRKNADDLC